MARGRAIIIYGVPTKCQALCVSCKMQSSRQDAGSLPASVIRLFPYQPSSPHSYIYDPNMPNFGPHPHSDELKPLVSKYDPQTSSMGIIWELGNTTLLGPTRDLCTRLSGLGAQQSVLTCLPEDFNSCRCLRTAGLSLSAFLGNWH